MCNHKINQLKLFKELFCEIGSLQVSLYNNIAGDLFIHYRTS